MLKSVVAHLQSHKYRSLRLLVATFKRTQHCWPTTPNIVGCYILHTFAHPVACCWELLRKVWKRSNVYLHVNERNSFQNCWTNNIMLGVVASVCTSFTHNIILDSFLPMEIISNTSAAKIYPKFFSSQQLIVHRSYAKLIAIVLKS